MPDVGVSRRKKCEPPSLLCFLSPLLHRPPLLDTISPVPFARTSTASHCLCTQDPKVSLCRRISRRKGKVVAVARDYSDNNIFVLCWCMRACLFGCCVQEEKGVCCLRYQARSTAVGGHVTKMHAAWYNSAFDTFIGAVAQTSPTSHCPRTLSHKPQPPRPEINPPSVLTKIRSKGHGVICVNVREATPYCSSTKIAMATSLVQIYLKLVD